MVFHRLHLENVSLTTMRFRLGLMITLLWSAIFLAPISTSANPYLAKPGEAPTPVYAATCATSGGFIHMYTVLDHQLSGRTKGKLLGISSFGASTDTYARALLRRYKLIPNENVKILALGGGYEPRRRHGDGRH